MNCIFYKLPEEKNIYTIEKTNNSPQISFFDFDGNLCFDFCGIHKKTKSDELNILSEFELPIQNFTENSVEEKNNYEKKISDVISFIKKHQLHKLVISRKKEISFLGKQIDLKNTFLNLCKHFPNSFIYCFIQKGICWLGATPEILGKYTKKTQIFETMSLAGTLPIEEEWSEKEIKEQKPVTEFIYQILSNFSQEIHLSKTYSIQTGNIKHLRNDFSFKIHENKIEEIVTSLHPTPAVCGIPKDFCQKSIKHFENYDRKLYSGYIKILTPDAIFYFVNLRCCEVYQNHVSAYVGGGITPLSSPEKEWRETELKSQTIGNHICFRKS